MDSCWLLSICVWLVMFRGHCDRPRAKKPGQENLTSLASIDALSNTTYDSPCACQYKGHQCDDQEQCFYNCEFDMKCSSIATFLPGLTKAFAADSVAGFNNGEILPAKSSCLENSALKHGFKQKYQMVVDPCMVVNGERMCWTKQLLRSWDRQSLEGFPLEYKKAKIFAWHIGHLEWDAVSMGWDDNEKTFALPAFDVGGNSNSKVQFVLDDSGKYVQSEGEVHDFHSLDVERFKFPAHPNTTIDRETTNKLYESFTSKYEDGHLYKISELEDQLQSIAPMFGLSALTDDKMQLKSKLRKDNTLYWEDDQEIIWAGYDIVVKRVTEGFMVGFIAATAIVKFLFNPITTLGPLTPIRSAVDKFVKSRKTTHKALQNEYDNFDWNTHRYFLFDRSLSNFDEYGGLFMAISSDTRCTAKPCDIFGTPNYWYKNFIEFRMCHKDCEPKKCDKPLNSDCQPVVCTPEEYYKLLELNQIEALEAEKNFVKSLELAAPVPSNG